MTMPSNRKGLPVKRLTITTILLAVLVGGLTPAWGAVSHVFGDGGKVYQFDAQCHRTSFIPPGITTHEMVNVLGQQVRCLVRRPDPFARCVKKLGAAPTVEGKFDHGDGKPGDWSGVDKLQAYVAAVAACSTARY